MKILHPTDFSPASYKALELAQHLRGLLGGGLTVLHVAEPRYASPAQFFSSENEKIFQQADQEWHQALAQQLQGLDPSARAVLEAGKPIPHILHHAAEHDLLVMGTHGEDSLKDRLIGTTAERVIAQAEKPVAVVGRDTRLRRFSHLLVAIALADPPRGRAGGGGRRPGPPAHAGELLPGRGPRAHPGGGAALLGASRRSPARLSRAPRGERAVHGAQPGQPHVRLGDPQRAQRVRVPVFVHP